MKGKIRIGTTLQNIYFSLELDEISVPIVKKITEDFINDLLALQHASYVYIHVGKSFLGLSWHDYNHGFIKVEEFIEKILSGKYNFINKS